MTTPLKPWERSSRSTGTAVAADSPPTPQVGGDHRTSGSGTDKFSTATHSTAAGNSSVPSVPPRVAGGTGGYFSSQPYGPTGFGGGYGGLGGGLGGGGLAGGYGNYGYGYRPYGAMGMYGNNNFDSPFVRQAEESTRVAFQSVESVVGAFSSISAMLESTYLALHSCFRAVLGVAQHFTRLKSQIWGIISAVAVLHRLRFWIKKLLRYLRLIRNGEREELWEEMVSSNENSSLLRLQGSAQESRMWPTVLFFAIIFGVPWLLWKLMSTLANIQAEASNEWHEEGQGEQTKVTARALYDFTPQREDELGFSAGEELVLAPRQLQSGWVLAGKDRKSGLVPVNYIQIQPPTRAASNSHGSNSETPPLGQGALSDENVPRSSSPSSARTRLLRAAEETLLND